MPIFVDHDGPPQVIAKLEHDLSTSQRIKPGADGTCKATSHVAGYQTQLLWVDVPVEAHHDNGLNCTPGIQREFGTDECFACRLPCCGTGIVPSHAGSEGPVRKQLPPSPLKCCQLKRLPSGGARKILSLTRRRSCKPASRILHLFHVMSCFVTVLLCC